MTEKTNDELMQEGMELAISNNEEDRSLAIFKFKKIVANDTSPNKFSSVRARMYIHFLESDLEMPSSNRALSELFMDNVVFDYNGNGRFESFFGYAKTASIGDPGYIKTMINIGCVFSPDINTFLNKEVGSMWVKSLRYDALVSQLDKWEKEDKLNSERMTTIRKIVGHDDRL